MSESARVDMSIDDLLAWAYAETRMADVLEDNSLEFSVLAGNDLAENIAKHRARSRWLDQQVAQRLDDKEERNGK